jgi:cation diffusion facilitator family transporter
MVLEIGAGIWYGSMALLADGWHMGTHVAALLISVAAYQYARWHEQDKRFTFGTAKVPVLGGFASAIALAVVALLMALESIQRFFAPRDIEFNQAIVVAGIGLMVNLVSAAQLHGGRARHQQKNSQRSASHDHNLAAAYLHVLADAFTSFLAIFALLAGKYLGYVWLDPTMGIAGGLLIALWSYGLLRETGSILLDSAVNPEMLSAIRSAIESDSSDKVSDLHLWRISPGKFAAIIAIVSSDPQQPDHYKKRLAKHKDLVHITIEVYRCRED